MQQASKTKAEQTTALAGALRTSNQLNSQTTKLSAAVSVNSQITDRSQILAASMIT